MCSSDLRMRAHTFATMIDPNIAPTWMNAARPLSVLQNSTVAPAASASESAVASGVDFVIVQGTEAGGHTGLVATMPLVPQVVDAVGDKVPVVAAGGIFDGRGLAASLALGADGVWMGSRFIATPEARTVRGYKDALIGAREDDTVITKGYSGK